MTIALRVKGSTGTGTGTSTAPTVQIPAGTHIGDTLVCTFNTNGGTPTFTPSAAIGTWTQRAQKANTSNGASVTVFTRVAVLADVSAPVETWGSSGGRSTNTVRAYSDVDLSTPIDVSIVTANGSSTAPAASTETPANSGDMSIGIYVASIAAANPATVPVWTAPSGYGNTEAAQTSAISGAGNCYGYTVDKLLTGTSATGPVTAGLDASHSWAAIQVLLRLRTVNTPPTIDAGPDQTVTGNDSVALSATFGDPDGDTVTVTWIQTAGTVVDLTDNGDGTADFVAPNVGDTLTFQATANDGQATTSDTMQVTVTPQSDFTLTLRATSFADWTTATLTPSVVVPTAVHFGDVVYIVAVTNGIQSCTTPAGWMLLIAQANTSNGATVRVFRKVMDPGNDAGATVTFTLGSTGRSYLLCLAYFDVDITTPEDVTVVEGTGTSTSPTAPTATPATDNDTSLVIYGTSMAVPAAGLGWTAPAGYGDGINGNTSATTGAGNVYVAAFDEPLGPSTAGTPTGTTAATINASRQWVGIRVLLKQKTGNSPPIPNAGGDQADIEPYTTVTLAGTASDPDGDPTTLSWAEDPTDSPQAAGFTDNGAGVAMFTAPPTEAGWVGTFVLTANDGNDTATDSCTVTVLPHNQWAASGGVLVPIRRQAITG